MAEYIFKPENDSSSLTSGIEDMCALLPKDWYGTIHGEIVRCRDCKWYDTAGLWCYEPSKTYIDEYGIEVCATVKPDGFCAWGERKEA